MREAHNTLSNTHWTKFSNENLLSKHSIRGDKEQNVPSPSRKKGRTKRRLILIGIGAALFRFGGGRPVGNQRENYKTDIRPRRRGPEVGKR